MIDLSSKVILVTGGGSGIGLAISKNCLALGAKVMIHTSINNKKEAEKLVDSNSNSATIATDLEDFASLKTLVEVSINKFGRIDGLVNNAGIFPRNDIRSITDDNYQKIMNINLRAPLFLSKYVSLYCIEHKICASIVNIGSINAYCGQDDLLVYSASKGALMTVTRNMADYLGKYKIRVNQINVGWTHTKKEHKTQLNAGNNVDWYKNINPLFQKLIM